MSNISSAWWFPLAVKITEMWGKSLAQNKNYHKRYYAAQLLGRTFVIRPPLS